MNWNPFKKRDDESKKRGPFELDRHYNPKEEISAPDYLDALRPDKSSESAPDTIKSDTQPTQKTVTDVDQEELKSIRQELFDIEGEWYDIVNTKDFNPPKPQDLRYHQNQALEAGRRTLMDMPQKERPLMSKPKTTVPGEAKKDTKRIEIPKVISLEEARQKILRAKLNKTE